MENQTCLTLGLENVDEGKKIEDTDERSVKFKGEVMGWTDEGLGRLEVLWLCLRENNMVC